VAVQYAGLQVTRLGRQPHRSVRSDKFKAPDTELDLFLWAVNDHAKLFKVKTPPEPTRSLLYRAYFMAQFPEETVERVGTWTEWTRLLDYKRARADKRIVEWFADRAILPSRQRAMCLSIGGQDVEPWGFWPSLYGLNTRLLAQQTAHEGLLSPAIVATEPARIMLGNIFRLKCSHGARTFGKLKER
jgi:hypothetical protein